MIPTRPRCHACQTVIVVDLRVSDELWEAVVHPSLRSTYMCLNCFASRADEKFIDWSREIELIPLSLVGQIAVQNESELQQETLNG